MGDMGLFRNRGYDRRYLCGAVRALFAYSRRVHVFSGAALVDLRGVWPKPLGTCFHGTFIAR